jgi:hypothetical protein
MDSCVVDNDAAACYDRVIPSIAMIKSRRAGVPRKATHVCLTLLLRMEYYVCTAYGVSSRAYSNLVDMILGIMQGAGHSGALWPSPAASCLNKWTQPLGPYSTPPLHLEPFAAPVKHSWMILPYGFYNLASC